MRVLSERKYPLPYDTDSLWHLPRHARLDVPHPGAPGACRPRCNCDGSLSKLDGIASMPPRRKFPCWRSDGRDEFRERSADRRPGAGLRTDNPVAGVRSPRARRAAEDFRYFCDDELARLLSVVPNPDQAPRDTFDIHLFVIALQ